MSEKDLEQPIDGQGNNDAKDNKKSKGKKDIKIDIAKTLQEFAKAENKLKETSQELETMQDTFKRTLAEYDNFRKRSAKEKSESYSNGKVSAVMALLPTIDTLEIALNAPCKDEEYKKGIEMVMNAAKASLENLGVEEIKAVGEHFDPNLHSAVMQEEKEGVESGVITNQLQKGYKMGDKVIRPSTVAVAQ